MTNVLYNSSVNHHPHGHVEVEVYDWPTAFSANTKEH